MAAGVTEAGLLTTPAARSMSAPDPARHVNLANGAVVSGGTIVDHGDGFTFNSDGSGVAYKGPLELTEDSASLTINQGITVRKPAVPHAGHDRHKRRERQPPVRSPRPGQTLDNVTINIGNATTADHIQP